MQLGEPGEEQARGLEPAAVDQILARGRLGRRGPDARVGSGNGVLRARRRRSRGGEQDGQNGGRL